MSGRDDDIEPQELRERLLYALMEPAGRLARVFRTPLSPFRDYAEMAYYHETRRRDLKMKDVADLMDVSMSKVALMSRALKENFLRDESAASLPRRIEFMLWAEPLTLAKIKQVLTDADAREVNDAVRALVEEGRVSKERRDAHTVYSLQISTDRRVWDSWLARIDGLQNAMRNVADAVYARFFIPGDETAFARTLTFRVRPDDIAILRELYEKNLFELVKQLDEAAESDPENSVPISLSMFWARHDLVGQVACDEEENPVRQR